MVAFDISVSARYNSTRWCQRLIDTAESLLDLKPNENN